MFERSGETMQGTIVVGYNGADEAEDGLAFAGQLAELTGARLILAYAYGGDSLPGQLASAGLGVTLHEAAEQVLHRGLRTLPYGIPARTRALPEAVASRALEQLAEVEQADLIVIGSTHFGPVSRVLIGSVGERLLHGAPCGVAVPPKGFRQRPPRKIARIGVCWDGSDEAERALDAGVELACDSTLELRLYTVIEPAALAYPTSGGVYVSDEEPLRLVAQERLAAALERVPAELSATSAVLVGDPARTLAEQAAREDVDLLLLGSRGYGPVRRVLLGGVSERLMRIAPCPVLIVPRSAGVAREQPAEATTQA